MQKTLNIEKMTKVVNVFNSIINNNIYVPVSDIATFLNAFCGTYTVTGTKINEMLEILDYQRMSRETDIKYISLKLKQ